MYLLHGKLDAITGKQNKLADILLQASKLVAKAEGCKLYLVSTDENFPNAVFVTEAWNNKADHANSLKIDEVRNLIMKCIPLLDGQHTKGQELDMLGGFGL